MDHKLEAAEAYVLAMRTGEVPATRAAAQHLAKDVVLNLTAGQRRNTISGYDAVVDRITGEWPNTPVFVKGFWSFARSDGNQVKVDATFPPMGAAPAAVHLTFSFDSTGKINVIDQETVPQTPAEPTETIPESARGLINGALRNNTPMSVAYVDEDGKPNLSLRGSVQVYSPTQLSIWVRNSSSGMARAIAKNPNIALLYRDSATRSTLVVQGVGHIETDPAIRDRVWDMIQDVEQKHETRESGCALIIDVTRMQGGTPRGGVRMQRNS
ncbi:MAG: pyridoxamine 5'-phosphate oxidase family protein [Chloroflexi bacterium]|nr:pyridoxamine 5'-phosphate oxidase family protein [Chloroflexota bacterium]MBV9897493.1 pyridoxamine 5'-phosphate oxidase family protein [Chloroflexota bacterium]